MPVNPQRRFPLPDHVVGSILQAARSEAGIALRETETLTGLDWRVLSRIERGERPCRVSEFVAIAAGYNIDPLTLFEAVLDAAE